MNNTWGGEKKRSSFAWNYFESIWREKKKKSCTGSKKTCSGLKGSHLRTSSNFQTQKIKKSYRFVPVKEEKWP